MVKRIRLHECIKYLTASNNILAAATNRINTKSRVKSNGSFLKQDKLKFTYEKVVNI